MGTRVTQEYKERVLIGWLIIIDLVALDYEKQMSMSFPSTEHIQIDCSDCKLSGKYQNGGMGESLLCCVLSSINNCWEMQPQGFPSLFLCSCAYHPHLFLLKSFISSLAWLKCHTQSTGAVDKCTKRKIKRLTTRSQEIIAMFRPFKGAFVSNWEILQRFLWGSNVILRNVF